MRNHFDQLAKQIGKEALEPCGPTFVNDEVSPETQHADLRHEPNPAHEAERARLGLLGRLAAEPCLLEVYAHAPNAEELRACLAKHIAFWQQRARHARSKGKKRQKVALPPGALAEPFLWVITAGVPAALLAELSVTTAPDWPEGVCFFGGRALRVGLVLASKLRCDRSSLLIRLMAAGPLLRQALDDLAALPEDAHEHAVAKQILLNLQHVLERKPDRTPEEQEIFMTMQQSWKKEREMMRTEGRAEGTADAVLTLLQVRGVAVPDAARERILAEKDLSHLKRWLERAVVAASASEVLDG